MKNRKFLVVVDPARREHRSINWIVQIAQQKRDEQLEIQLFIGFESGDKTEPDTPVEVVKSTEWFEELVKPLQDAGLEFNAEVVWTVDWRHSVIEAARRTEADIIMMAKSAAEHQKGRITDTKWGLVRNSPVPVAIIGRDSTEAIKCILAAVDMQDKDQHSKEMNKDILTSGFELAGYYGADFHVVNAYKDSEDFPHRDDVRRIVDIPLEKIHRDMGRPEDVICDMAQKIQADLVILGSPANRKGIRVTLRGGNISEKVIEKLSTDILVLN